MDAGWLLALGIFALMVGITTAINTKGAHPRPPRRSFKDERRKKADALARRRDYAGSKWERWPQAALDESATLRNANARLTRELNTARAKVHELEQKYPLSLYVGACPPRVLVDTQGRRWQQITTETRETFDTGEWQGETRGISTHLQRMLDD